MNKKQNKFLADGICDISNSQEILTLNEFEKLYIKKVVEHFRIFIEWTFIFMKFSESDKLKVNSKRIQNTIEVIGQYNSTPGNGCTRFRMKRDRY
jgi:hypothetical protein